ncbi:MAG: 1,4-alpha-glucan branching protein GlgB [Woeseia sp.]
MLHSRHTQLAAEYPEDLNIAFQRRANSLSAGDADAVRLIEARHHDPFAVLGRHGEGKSACVRVFLPRTRKVFVESETRPMLRIGDTDLFEFCGDTGDLPGHYRLLVEDSYGHRRTQYDPYSFEPLIDEGEFARFNTGTHTAVQRLLGANARTVAGIKGTLFAVWAPNAERVSVVGDFNEWDGRCHPMRSRGQSGVWELFLPELRDGPYKFELRQRETGDIGLKSDPYAKFSEQRPATASRIMPESDYQWRDHNWLERRSRQDWKSQPMATYEVHLGSWRRTEDNRFLNYKVLAEQLAAYAAELGFTHVELLPISEHPLDESWGYQTTGYFSPTSRHGTPDEFRAFVDHCHQRNIGVLLDWVPAHFPRDAHALAKFDGTSLYEYHDVWKAEHRDWGTLVFNYERNEVRSFLFSNALYWLREFHIDGLRVDAVASMLYLDFSRQADTWVPNRLGGNQNLEAVDFICELNSAIARECPDCLMIAEESTDWQGVTHPAAAGGLGFHLKWNMGWMHDSLNYFAKEPIHRKHHQNWLTFGPTYAYDENFVLPLSHDEVVHLKRSLVGKMPGDDWQRFANLRLLYAYQWTFPGKKLLFMGGEFAQTGEWNAMESLPWPRPGDSGPAGVSALIADLNRLQHRYPALAWWDCDPRGFEWLDGDNRDMSVIAFMRHAPGQTAVVVLNFTPVVRHGYRVGVPEAGNYREIMNSDLARYGGSDVCNPGDLASEEVGWHGRSQSIVLTLPPLAGVILIRSNNG